MVKAKKRPRKSEPVIKLTRKEQRKQKLLQKRENKRQFFSSKKNGKQAVAVVEKASVQKQKAGAPFKKKPPKLKEIPIEKLLSGSVDSGDDESIASDFSDKEVNARLPKQKQLKAKPATTTTARPDAITMRRRELQRQKDLENAARKQRVKQLRKENEDEEKVIARLEKKLKLNKTKDKNRLVRKMFNDGLDYALEFCLDDEEEKQKQELKERRKKEQLAKNNSGWSDEEDGIFDDETDESEDNERIGKDDDLNDASLDEEEGEHDSGSDEDSDEPSTKKAKVAEQEEFVEDIYGRKRDKDGNVVKDELTKSSDEITQKYIPPHQRALMALQGNDKQAQIMERLHKQCKGLLNRLSEANMHKIASGLEELYMKNSRYNMNETLMKLLNEALIARTMTKERMVQEHMVVIAFLHAHIGSEIGAHFLQTFVEAFDKFVRDINHLQVEDKRLNNIILVLAYMYIFKIYDHRLLLEIIGKLTESLCEKAIECLLLIFQSVGFKLRKDDPLAFKQMMMNVQRTIAESPLELKENLRLKFMVDILNAVKNNNIQKIPQFDPELAENLRKSLKAILRTDKYVITLNIAIDDLLRADQVGKWWIVGSAWSGNIDDVGAAKGLTSNSQKTPSGLRFSEKLLSLAKQQKMNTEERRNIFCIIMSAEDYVDAFEKIHHLALKDNRIVAYVVLHCCLNEKRSNPYYSYLALKFCDYNRKFQLAFQFASWDRISEISALSKQQIRNLANFLQHLILNGGLSVSVLKVVDFLQLDKLSLLLMKETMLGLLLAENESEVYLSFERIVKNSNLSQFKNSIRLFIQHFLLQQESNKLKLSDDQLPLLKKRIDHVDNLLAYVDL